MVAHDSSMLIVCVCPTGASLLYIEAELPDSYPSEAIPEFSLSNINNNHFSTHTREDILRGLQEQVLTCCSLLLSTAQACMSIPAAYLSGWKKVVLLTRLVAGL